VDSRAGLNSEVHTAVLLLLRLEPLVRSIAVSKWSRTNPYADRIYFEVLACDRSQRRPGQP